jgi:hypothetical protein
MCYFPLRLRDKVANEPTANNPKIVPGSGVVAVGVVSTVPKIPDKT